jgi:agmatinase
MVADIYETLQPFGELRKLILALGGEHTISFPLVKLVKQNFPDLVVVVLDAHADLRESWEGSIFSHACTLKRIAELGTPIFHLGLRSLSKEEHFFLQGQTQIRSYSSKEIILANGLVRFRKDLTALGRRNVYLSLDIDALDPSIVPGTGTPEPGGLEWAHLLETIKIVVDQGVIRGIDLCELMPLSGSRLSEFVAAKIIFKILSYLFYHPKKVTHHV